jgi:hypothetical protein
MLVISFVQRYILVTSENLDQGKNALTNNLLNFWRVQIMLGVSFFGLWTNQRGPSQKQNKEKINSDTQIPLPISPPIFSSQLINTTNNTYLVALIKL